MKMFFQFLALGLFVTSCVTMHHGSISSNVIETHIQYKDMAIGVAEISHLLGLGPSSRDALVLRAKKDLINSRPLEADERYINFTVDFKTFNFLMIIIKTKVIVTAEVVQLGVKADQEAYGEKYLQKIASVQMDNNLFEIGDSVLIKDKNIGTIISVEKPNLVTVAYSGRNGDVVTEKISVNRIYSINKNYKGRQIGENTTITVNGKNQQAIMPAIVIGIGLKGVLVKTRAGRIEFSAYE